MLKENYLGSGGGSRLSVRQRGERGHRAASAICVVVQMVGVVLLLLVVSICIYMFRSEVAAFAGNKRRLKDDGEFIDKSSVSVAS